jgi:hypothetical protein
MLMCRRGRPARPAIYSGDPKKFRAKIFARPENKTGRAPIVEHGGNCLASRPES